MSDPLTRAIRLARATSQRTGAILYIRRVGDRYAVSTAPIGTPLFIAHRGQIMRTPHTWEVPGYQQEMAPAQA